MVFSIHPSLLLRAAIRYFKYPHIALLLLGPPYQLTTFYNQHVMNRNVKYLEEKSVEANEEANTPKSDFPELQETAGKNPQSGYVFSQEFNFDERFPSDEEIDKMGKSILLKALEID